MFLELLRTLFHRVRLYVVIATRSRGQIRRGVVRALFCLGAAGAWPAYAQVPQITTAGVVNAASYAQPISPGSIVAIFGTNLASKTVTARETPLPDELSGTSVTLNGVKARLFFVSPGQVNLEAPWSLQSALDISGAELRSATVVVSTPSGSSVPVQVPLYQESPAIFSLDASGCGRAAVLNVAPDGSVSLNSPSNSAAPGDYISIFGTGLGLVYNPPPDGVPASAQSLETAAGVLIDGQPINGIVYDGLAPRLVGVNQTNLLVLPGIREGCAVPIAVGAFQLSPSLSISIHTGRGQCVDPPIQSYGRIVLTKTVTSGTTNAGETDTLTAVFPSAPGLKPPPFPQPPLVSIGRLYPPLAVTRSCAVAGHTDLSAGTIQVQANNSGASATAQPINQTGGVAYQQSLPAGFVAPGPYAISASGGPVVFHAAVNLDSPIQIQTPFPPGTVIPSGQPLKVSWTGGVPGDLVKVALLFGRGFNRVSDYAYVDAGSGSFTFVPSCANESPNSCFLGPPGSYDVQVIVEVSPGSPISVSAQGITGPVQVFWMYRFVFGGLVLAP